MSTTTATTQTQTEFVPTGDTTATLNFYLPPADGSRPHQYIDPSPAGQPVRNFGNAIIDVPIHDLRGNESTLSLDKEAFTLHKIPSALSHTDFSDPEKVKAIYYPEITSIIKSHVPGAKEVVIFDHTVRRSDPNAPRGPAMRAHIDQTPFSAGLRLKRHLSAEQAEEVVAKGTRYQIVNVWRPINGAVVSNPLAFADSSTVEEEDLVPIAHIYDNYEGETAGVKYREGQKWWYVSGQTSDEVTLIKCFDSWKGEEGEYRRVPHTAFVHPGTPEGARGRESIEVRCLVVG
ncbi:putative 7alpha-cephem-methoxylase P8 chain related protein [Wilcoxina mikolae CBS 423.85]|nr:putative 7alpha-cephem-methoxylase P8 chain related protein [Wilcoxina mikolae CBS 423.85]